MLRSWGVFILTGMVAACATAPSDAPSAPALTADALVGASMQDADRMLGGAATFERREGAALLRRYALGACDLLVILRPDESGVMRVTHANASAAPGDAEVDAEVDACLAAAGVTWRSPAGAVGGSTPQRTQTAR